MCLVGQAIWLAAQVNSSRVGSLLAQLNALSLSVMTTLEVHILWKPWSAFGNNPEPS